VFLEGGQRGPENAPMLVGPVNFYPRCSIEYSSGRGSFQTTRGFCGRSKEPRRHQPQSKEGAAFLSRGGGQEYAAHLTSYSGSPRILGSLICPGQGGRGDEATAGVAYI